MRGQECCAEGKTDGNLDVVREILSEHISCGPHLDGAGSDTQEAAEEIFRTVHRFVEKPARRPAEGGAARSAVKPKAVGIPGLDSEYRVKPPEIQMRDGD